MASIIFSQQSTGTGRDRDAERGQPGVKQINQNGGLLGPEVEIVYRDTEIDPSLTRSKFRELIPQKEIDASIGGYGSANCLALLDEMANFQ